MNGNIFRLVVLVLLAVLALPIAAVAQDGEVTDLGEGELKVSFWHGLGGSDGATLNEMLVNFVDENPDIGVTAELIPWDTLYAKLQAAFLAGTPPDLVLMHASELPQYASYGVIREMSDWYTSGGGWLPDDDLAPSTYGGMHYDGVLYGIPLDNHGMGQWINVDHFEAAGLDPDGPMPDSYEGWVELFQQLTLDENGNNAASDDFDAENVVQWGYSVRQYPRVIFLAHLAQHGGSLVSEDGTTVTVNSEAGIAALQNSVDLVYKYNVSPVPAGFNAWEGYANGALSVLPAGTWFLNFSRTIDVNSKAIAFNQFGAEPAAWFGAHTFFVPAILEGEKLGAVETLLQWISANQGHWAMSGQVPALLSVQASLDPENFPSNIVMGASFADHGVVDFSSTVTAELYRTGLEPELNAALNGQKTAEQALNDAAERMQAILDRGE
ncbi:MAG: extracellular solute-binding protein [Anaerolineaceae bacterium]|nr:extracellular solute-binding protein [Anaerolineaceae bacterium]MCY3907059.1 extracellular solute-binding protein [Anaerolineaceae bacterium]